MNWKESLIKIRNPLLPTKFDTLGSILFEYYYYMQQEELILQRTNASNCWKLPKNACLLI